MRLSPCVLVQPDGWARGEREGYGGPCDVTSLSLSLASKVMRQHRSGVAFRPHLHSHKVRDKIMMLGVGRSAIACAREEDRIKFLR